MTPAHQQTVLPIKGHRVAVDSAGNVYTTLGDQVLKLAVGSSTPTVLPFTDLDSAAGVAVDAAGGVFVADFYGNRVLKLAAGSSTPIALPFTGLANPLGVAVDAAGNVYVASNRNQRFFKLMAGSNTQVELPIPVNRNLFPAGIAVDAAGNVYVTLAGGSSITKLPAGSTTPTDLCASCPQSSPPVYYVAVDAAGNLYGAGPDFLLAGTENRVLRFAAGSGTATILPFTDLDGPEGSVRTLPRVDVAVDSAGNVYATSHAGVLKLSMG
jgi:serine/threonine-protein kinase